MNGSVACQGAIISLGGSQAYELDHTQFEQRVSRPWLFLFCLFKAYFCCLFSPTCRNGIAVRTIGIPNIFSILSNSSKKMISIMTFWAEKIPWDLIKKARETWIFSGFLLLLVDASIVLTILCGFLLICLHSLLNINDGQRLFLHYKKWFLWFQDDLMVKDSVKFLVDTMIKNENNMSNKSEGKSSNNEGTISLTVENSSENGSLCLC